MSTVIYGDEIKLFVKVCSKCGRQVYPAWDHNLGLNPTVLCEHGGDLLESVPWRKIEVVPIEHLELARRGRDKGEDDG